MPVPSLRFGYEGTVYSPFTGQPAESEEHGPNENDPSLMFAYHGDGGAYGHVSPRLAGRLPEDWEELEPLELAEQLEFENLLVLVVDAGWNGVNYYGYAPLDEDSAEL